jgi:NAD(P)-dependent dehydrogenase (short-subunit alcohol dehydrogenase family)
MALKGKTALITGGTSGIGRAVAERLANDGAEVIITGRDETRGREVVEAIESAGGTARFIAADLANFQDLNRLAQAAADIDVLVNNAGVFPGGPTDQTTEEAFDLTFDVNVKAPFFLTAAIAPRMAAKGGGSIINISTMAATIGMNGLAAYGASKAAVESLTKAWTAEYAAQGVRINTVAPGPTRTPASAAMGEMFDVLAASTPAGHGAAPKEIAAAVSFLASDEASFIYGAILAADGGRVAV